MSYLVSLPAIAAALLIGGCATAIDASDPILQTGQEDSGDFAPFQSGDRMTVLTGVQAGMWLMPTVRHQGFIGEPDLQCTVLDLDKDVFVANQAAHANSRKRNGWTNVQYNMQVMLPDADMNDSDELAQFNGDRVLFECTAIDEAGNSLVVSRAMILTTQ